MFTLEQIFIIFGLHLYISYTLTGDSLTYSHMMPFSTFDRDQDTSNGNCADISKAGWWFKNCTSANLNGQFYEKGSHSNVNDGTAMIWKDWKGYFYSIARTQMKIRPKHFTSEYICVDFKYFIVNSKFIPYMIYTMQSYAIMKLQII